MADRDFDSLLIHTCSIVQAGSTSEYGHTLPSWTSGTTTTAGIACRLMPRPTARDWQAELEQTGMAGTVISDFMLFVDWADVPSSLKASGAETTHRVTSVLKGAVSVDAGPFDISYIRNEAGEDHHFRLALKRVA